MKNRRIITLTVFLGLVFVSVAYAQTHREESHMLGQQDFWGIQGVRIGQDAKVMAAVSQEFQYDSNIFLTAEDRKTDFISMTNPKVLLDVPIGIDKRHLFQTMYEAEIGVFSDYTDQNYVNQNVSANLNVKLPSGYFSLTNDFKDTIDRSDTEFTQQVRRFENFARLMLGLEANKLAYEISFSHFLRDYHETESESLNYTDAIVSGTVFYQLSSATKALCEFNHGEIAYPKDARRDGDYNQVRLGLKGDLTGKTAGIIKVGYQQRTYDVEGPSGFSGFVMEAGLNTQFTERTALELIYQRTAVESISANNNYYTLDSLRAQLVQKLSRHLTFSIFTQYDRRDFPEVDPASMVNREDEVLTEGIDLRYDWKDKGRVTAGYRYKEDMSNIDSNDYTDNLVFLRVDFLI